MTASGSLVPMAACGSLEGIGMDWLPKHEGIRAIVYGFNEFHSRFEKGVHHYTNRVIDTKSQRMYWYSNAVWIRGKERILAAGDYEADIVQVEGTWKLKKVMTTYILHTSIED
eukprot:TRINITY_DN77305_c0_g1_i1.p1 TRINITY_DN77305_c0_g1~~TRINITY_DN77305_c0_g1_i1.p1  ORF type:complete len:113 (-),score=23.05 TRINITY_DN77305_c0_g1_i1:231-569(-)